MQAWVIEIGIIGWGDGMEKEAGMLKAEDDRKEFGCS